MLNVRCSACGLRAISEILGRRGSLHLTRISCNWKADGSFFVAQVSPDSESGLYRGFPNPPTCDRPTRWRFGPACRQAGIGGTAAPKAFGAALQLRMSMALWDLWADQNARKEQPPALPYRNVAHLLLFWQPRKLSGQSSRGSRGPRKKPGRALECPANRVFGRFAQGWVRV